MTDFVANLDRMIAERRKMTSPLYQTILDGRATERLLRSFVVHRWPIKRQWTRNLLGVASRIDDHDLRALFVENAFEEETGAISNSHRHVDSFATFGRHVGVVADELDGAPVAPETAAVVEHNVRTCNSSRVHFTAGVASVILLMEGQPPIVNGDGVSMLSIMCDVYGFPPDAYDYFIHHASADEGEDGVSELEDEHAAAARDVLRRYCTTDTLRSEATTALARALDLRHRHFDMILATGYDEREPVFRYALAA